MIIEEYFMRIQILSVVMAIGLIPGSLLAAETVKEKVQDTTNDMQRDVDQKTNRMEEATCLQSDTECLKEKAENRKDETTDSIDDKANELKNDVDD